MPKSIVICTDGKINGAVVLLKKKKISNMMFKF